MRPLLVAALLAASATPSAAQMVHGRVLERGTDKPVASAIVELRDGSNVRAQARTLDDGSFVLPVPGVGTYRVAAARVGYESLLSGDLVIARPDSLDLLFRMTSLAVQLDPVQVNTSRYRSARLAGFYERSTKRRQGHFLTRDVIEQARSSRTSDLLRRIPGLSFRATRRGGYAVRGRGGCEPQVYIDGMDVSMFGNVTSVDDLVRPEDLEGVEVYGSSSIPVEFIRNHPGNECGAVMLWTRMGR
ncbi:MAG: TonB-dependent receptor plug domain-containing protein [Longimicrobiaceae bacterium]